jgi:hypothetical protein
MKYCANSLDRLYKSNRNNKKLRAKMRVSNLGPSRASQQNIRSLSLGVSEPFSKIGEK